MKTFEPFIGKAEEMMAAASEATGGLTDYGDPRAFMPGLKALLEAMDNDTLNFTPDGFITAYQMLVGNLIARLLTEQGWKDHPQCLQQPIRRPLIIIGIPRTGTTALHKLLSVDPQFQGVERWLSAAPMPRPPTETWPQNPWYQACVKGIEDMFANAPEMRAAHDLRADDVDECLEILKQDFCSNYYGSRLFVPDYDRWWLQQSEAPAYRRLYKVLQLIGANSPDKTWLLKNPGHVANINLLLDTFPDACIIQTHRDPVKATASVCSVLKQARTLFEGDRVDLAAIGQRELAYWSNAVANAEQARKRAPEQFLDVIHSDFHKNPLAVVKTIYRHFGFELTNDVEIAMAERIKRNPEGSHGKHVYSLEEFGLTESAIAERYQHYCALYLKNN